jgi:hypothetical protein
MNVRFLSLKILFDSLNELFCVANSFKGSVLRHSYRNGIPANIAYKRSIFFLEFVKDVFADYFR